MRLLRGDFDAETIYSDDPVAVATRFEAEGAAWIHVVDLDAARTGEARNLHVIEQICAAVRIPVQSGGGVRNDIAARRLLDAGVRRAVLGTAAVEHPELVERLARAFPNRIAVGLDARGHDVATRGWVEGGGADLITLAKRFASSGVGALVVTEIGRDGTLEGPDLEQLASVLEAVDIPVIASGGVGTLDDLRALAELQAGDRKLAGAIAGRALYEQRFTVAEAVKALA